MVELTHENATHNLRCSHCVYRRNRRVYHMRCHVLKDMGDGRLKVLVFGEHNWKGNEHIQRTRYVEASRVSRRKPDEH